MCFLTVKIQDHLAAFQDLFPGRRLLPKHHFMLHYSRLIELLGPLRLAWCMRFEGKHSYFTKLGKIINNFKNICSTFALRHQLRQAYCLASETGYNAEQMHFSRSVVVDVACLPEPTIEMLKRSGVEVNRNMFMCNSVRINDVAYYRNMFVITSCKNDILTFCRIEDIFLQDLIPRFLLHAFTSSFNSHLSAYAVQPTSEKMVMAFDQFLDHYPLTAYDVDGMKYVVLKNFVFDVDEYAQL